MSDNIITIVVVLVFIMAPFWLIYKMDTRVAKKGALFTGQSTKSLRLLAIILGVIFIGVTITEVFFSQEINVVFPILAFALIAYGAGQLLRKLQKSGENAKSTAMTSENIEPAIETLNQDDRRWIPQNRFARFLKTITIILIISAIFLYAAWLATTHPKYISLICLSLILFVVLYFVYYKFKWRAIAGKAKAAFDNVYEHSIPRPKYEMKYSYGYPHFTVTFASDKERTAANEEGLNKRFSREIEEICKNTGSKERPFQVEDGITFTSEEYLKNLRKTGI